MLRYKSAKDIKKALLSCETVELGKVVAFINDNDEIEIHFGDEGRVASLSALPKVIEDLWKVAEGMPSSTPKPVSYDKVEPADKLLGPDSTSDSPWSDPKVTTQPVPDGKSGDPGLGDDTTSDSPWADPQVVKDPEKKEPTLGDGLSDPDLGSDTTKNPTSWENVAGSKAAEDSTYDGTNNEGDPDREFFPERDDEPHKVINDGEEPASLSEFHSARIVDTFDNGPTRGPSYKELVTASPSRNLLRDIADHEKWAANDALRDMGVVDEVFSLSEGEGLFEDREAFADKIREVMDDKSVINPARYVKDKKDYTAQAAGGAGAGAGATGTGEGVALPAGGSVTHPKKKKDEDKDKESGLVDRGYEKPVFDEHGHGNGHGKGKAFTPLWDRDKESKAAQLAFKEYLHNVMASDDVSATMDMVSRGIPIEGLYEAALNAEAPQVLAKLNELIEPYVAAGSRIKENWGNDGNYTRDLDAESAEDLYHLVRSLGQDDDYDWSSYKPREPGDMTGDELVDQGVVASDKEAVDDAAKEYWKNYFKGYGEELVKDDSGKKDRKDPERKKNEEGWKPKVNETPGKDYKGSDVKEAQISQSPDGSPAGGEVGGPASPAAQPMGQPADPSAQAPSAPPQGSPNAGNEGLKALGWTDQDIQAMEEDQKQKILQNKIKKPGAPAPKAPGAPGAEPGAPAPKAPGAPGAPGGEVPVPDAGPSPVPASPKPMASRDKVLQAFRMLAQVPEAAPAPAAPAEVPAAVPGPGQEGVDPAFGGAGGDSPEAQALQIFNEILEQEVKASSAEQVPATKAQILVQRLLNEVGMTIQDARNLFGLTKDKGFNSLFK